MTAPLARRIATDTFFAAIGRHRSAWKVLNLAEDSDKAAEKAYYKAFAAIADNLPTSLPGLRALIKYLLVYDEGGFNRDTESVLRKLSDSPLLCGEVRL